MTWSRFDDAARKHPKALMAGNEAWGFWCAAIMYCNQYGTDGLIPDGALASEVLPCPIKPVKARVLAMKLCEATLYEGGPGLFTRDDKRGGFVVHDFLEWNPSKATVDAKRKADRERKGRPRDSTSDSERIPRGIPDGKRADSGAPSESFPPSRGHARASQPSPPSPAIPSPPAEPGSAPPVDSFDGSPDETICPLDLHERAEKAGVFRFLLEHMPGVTLDQLRDAAREEVSYRTIGKGAGSTRRFWMRHLREHLRKAHENNRLRPPGAIEHDANAPPERIRREQRRASEALAAAYASAPQEETGTNG